MSEPYLERETGVNDISRSIRWFEVALWASLLACAGFYILFTWRWPLVGDSSLIHYIAFLMDRGWAPYRDLGDMNLPGSFLIEWAAMHVFGGGSLAWRLFDLTLLAAIAAGNLAIAGCGNRLAGIFAAVLFAVIHGRDGINNTGQRDLVMAALVVLSYAFLFHAWRRGSPWATYLFGFAIAAAGTIKPTALPLGVLLLAMLAVRLRRQKLPAARSIALGVAGFLTPLLICVVFLWREHAIDAFVHSLRTVVPYFAGLGRRPLGFLLVHSVSPLMALVAVWLVLAAASTVTTRSWDRWVHPWSGEEWERAALLLGAAAMLAGFVLQGKGFPYHRYPFLALLLPVISLDLAGAMRKRGVQMALGAAGFALGAFVLAPQSVAEVHRYDWRNQELIAMIQSDLTQLGGPALSGRVQCIDTISGCTTALYRLRLEPATGLLSDFLVFGPQTTPAVREARAGFEARIAAHLPEVIVITAGLFPDGPGDFRKLETWPAFQQMLNASYGLCWQRTPPDPVRWWGRVETPQSYRVYVLARCLEEGQPCAVVPPKNCGP
jgi:hypothetical protein